MRIDDFMRETRFAKLHPALCFAFFMLAIGMTALVQHPVYLAASLIGALCLNIGLSGMRALKRFAALIPFWLVLSAINPLLNPLGERVLFSCWGRNYTLEALGYGMVIAGMFVAMLQWFSAYNAVMTQDKFSYLFAALAPSLALLLTTVLRMIPNLMRKARQIALARRCAGLGAGENAGTKGKIAEGMSNLSALTSWALEGSVVTSDSMNSRGYGAGRRSCYHSYRFRTEDIALSVAWGALLMIVLLVLLNGGGAAEYTPNMSIAPVTGINALGAGAYMMFLLTPTLLNVKEEIQWSISRSRI